MIVVTLPSPDLPTNNCRYAAAAAVLPMGLDSKEASWMTEGRQTSVGDRVTEMIHHPVCYCDNL